MIRKRKWLLFVKIVGNQCKQVSNSSNNGKLTFSIFFKLIRSWTHDEPEKANLLYIFEKLPQTKVCNESFFLESLQGKLQIILKKIQKIDNGGGSRGVKI